jgi:predicted ribosome quality control (RQC) complex YloA/Tae2 family protein
MDQFLLQAVAAEAATRLLEQEVVRVSRLGAGRYLLRFATRGRDNLLLSVRPDLPRLHLVRGDARVPEEPPDSFASVLDREIGGAVLTALEKRPWDRVVHMDFRLPRREDGASGRRLVVELLGRSANLLLLDESGTIRAHCRDLRSEFRAPVDGETYRDPPGREQYDGITPGPEALRIVRERFGSPAAFLDPLSPLLARDLRAIGKGRQTGALGEGEASEERDADRRLGEILEVARSGRWAPVVYSVRPLAEMVEGDRLSRDDLLVSPLPLLFPQGAHGGGAPAITPFASPSDAAEAVFGLLERQRDFQARREHHEAIIRAEIRRIATLMGKLREEAGRAANAELHRRQGEALLGGLAAAKVEGSVARVPDPYAPGGGEISIPIDPALSLQENSQVLFRRYKKGKRGLVTIEARLLAATHRLREWEQMMDAAAAARSTADLERLREAMGELGVVHAPAATKAPAPIPAREKAARVRRHTSPDGLVILVGKNGDENDTLTFRIASPWDFWLHAAGAPGAHVVVRNPRRLKAIPEATLQRAAEIAAFYSGARTEGKVEVHYTQRKHVHKRKGMPSGQVLLRRFRSIQVAPRLPRPALEEV